MDLEILEEKLENYICMYKADVEDFLYEELDDKIDNVIENAASTLFILNNVEITLFYDEDDNLSEYSIDFI